MNKNTRYVINQMIEKQEYKKNNGPIESTADQLWKYSGKVEETNPDILLIQQEMKKIKRYIR